MPTQKDTDDLIRLGHVREATQTPEEFTTDTKWHGTIALVGAAADDAFQGLDSASDAHDLDESENTKVKTKWVQRVTVAVKYVVWLAGDAKQRLVNLRPGDPEPPSDEKQDRENLVEKLQAVNPNVVLKSRPTAAINTLNKVVELVNAAPAQWFSDTDKADLKKHVEQCQAAWQAMVAESLDDDKWMAALQSARVRANQTLVAGRAILGGVLSLNDSPLTVDDVILKITHKKKDKTAEADGAADPSQQVVPPTTPDVPVA